MTRNEIGKVFSLLAQYYPKARQLKDPKTKTAWAYVLENFTYQDVKKAVVLYAAKNKFFPDVPDITGTLTPERPPAKKIPDLQKAALDRLMSSEPPTP